MRLTRLTIGMRCRIRPGTNWYHKDGNNEALLVERSSRSFSFLRLGQKELKKEDPNTVVGGGAWLDEDDLEHIDSDFEANLDFMDWHQENEDNFCGDCGEWFPQNGMMDPDTERDHVCPNEECPGRLYDSGICPSCKTPKLENSDECPKCGFDWTLQSI